MFEFSKTRKLENLDKKYAETIFRFLEGPKLNKDTFEFIMNLKNHQPFKNVSYKFSTFD